MEVCCHLFYHIVTLWSLCSCALFAVSGRLASCHPPNSLHLTLPLCCAVGSPITRGQRYILAGFVDYDKNATHDSFLDLYSPEHDGYAAMVGFRNNDEIVAVQDCYSAEKTEEEMEEEEDVGEHRHWCSCREARSIPYRWCWQQREGLKNGGSGTVVQHILVTGIVDMPDDQWVALVQSCERMQPNENTVFVVQRLDVVL